MKPARCPGPQSRRDFLKFGALRWAAWRRRHRALEVASAPSRAPGHRRHLHLAAGRAAAHGNVRHEAERPGGISRRLPPHPHQCPRHRRLRTSADARAHRRQVHDHPLDRPQFRRSRRRAQALPHRPRSALSRPASSTITRWSARWSTSVRGQRPGGVPNYICGTDGGRDQIDVFSFGSAYLGPSVHPFTFAGDPTDPNFQVRNLRSIQPEERLHERLESAAAPRTTRRPAAITPARWRRWAPIATGRWTC